MIFGVFRRFRSPRLRVGLCHCSHGFFLSVLRGRRVTIRGRSFRLDMVPLGKNETADIQAKGVHFFADLHTEALLCRIRALHQKPANRVYAAYAGPCIGADPGVAARFEWMSSSMKELTDGLSDAEFRDWLNIEPRDPWWKRLGRLMRETA